MARASSTLLASLSTAGLFSLVTSIAIARSIGLSEFGLYSLLVCIQSVVGLVGGYCINIALAKLISETKVRSLKSARALGKTGIILALVLSAISSLIYISMAGFIGVGLYHESRLVALIPFSALVVVSSILFSTVLGIAQGCQRLGLVSFMQVTSASLSLGVIIALVPLFGIVGVFFSFFIVQIGVALSVLVYLNNSSFDIIGIAVRGELGQIAARILTFSSPAVASGLIILFGYWLGSTELVIVAGFEALGLFSIAFVFFNALNIIPQSLVIPLMPRVSEQGAISPRESHKTAETILRYAAVAPFPIFFLLAVFPEPIITTLYGETFSSSAPVVSTMAMASYLFSLSAVIGGALVGKGRMVLALGLNIVWAVVFAIVALLLIPVFGAGGLAVAYASSYCAGLVVTLFLSERLLDLHFRSSHVSIAVATLCLLVAVLMNTVNFETGWICQVILFILGGALVLAAGRDVLSAIVGRLLPITRRLDP